MRGILRHSIVDVEVFIGQSGDLERVVLYPPGSAMRGVVGRGADGMVSILDAIRSLLDGTDVNAVRAIDIDLSPYTPFQQSVLTAARRIFRGTTVTYAELAIMAGHPAAVRAVASVMRNNHFPLIIPCHRVVRSDGGIGGFMGKQTGPAIDIKRRLLESEGGLGVGKEKNLPRRNTKGHERKRQ